MHSLSTSELLYHCIYGLLFGLAAYGAVETGRIFSSSIWMSITAMGLVVVLMTIFSWLHRAEAAKTSGARPLGEAARN